MPIILRKVMQQKERSQESFLGFEFWAKAPEEVEKNACA